MNEIPPGGGGSIASSRPTNFQGQGNKFGEKSTFSEYGHVACQIKGNESNILTLRKPSAPGQKNFFGRLVMLHIKLRGRLVMHIPCNLYHGWVVGEVISKPIGYSFIAKQYNMALLNSSIA